MMGLIALWWCVLYVGILVAVGTVLFYIIKNAVKKGILEAHAELKKRGDVE